MSKIKIEQARPMVRMLEQPRSFAYEIWSWRVDYLIVPDNSGCKSCKTQSGTVYLPITGLRYSKSELSKLVAENI